MFCFSIYTFCVFLFSCRSVYSKGPIARNKSQKVSKKNIIEHENPFNIALFYVFFLSVQYNWK